MKALDAHWYKAWLQRAQGNRCEVLFNYTSGRHFWNLVWGNIAIRIFYFKGFAVNIGEKT